ncbi:MAG: hypothetical protein F6K48_26205 [Okeania sp. SIO3H1]|uniref:hypothetical protein n=1 Tax=Okeania sp. SIO1I7 TaxID=2607772 RepID=UPI0013CA06D2|nr:hypothetical protein [Okeania sp. SIO1I7]NEN92205.1 hypothetical protein [Okeania sp. SIO3H1]NET30290.1 hypothetical protein [Okeania sp. SIO1I7]
MVKKYQNERGQWITELEPGEEPMGETALCVKLPKSIDDYIRNKQNRSEWMRQVLVAAARGEMESHNQSD